MRWDSSPLFFEIILRNCLYICIVFKTEKDSIMETTAYTSDNIITRSYEEYHQVILNYITYRIAHRYEAEDLTQDVFVRLMDYKQMLRPDTVKYFLFTIARNLVTDYIRRYYKKQEIDRQLHSDQHCRERGYNAIYQRPGCPCKRCGRGNALRLARQTATRHKRQLPGHSRPAEVQGWRKALCHL